MLPWRTKGIHLLTKSNLCWRTSLTRWLLLFLLKVPIWTDAATWSYSELRQTTLLNMQNTSGMDLQCNIMWCGSDYNVIFNPCCSRSQSFSSMSKSAGSRKTPRANHPGVHSDEDFCLLGLDSFLQGEDRVETIRLGLVVKILWGTEVQLDGDGGFR